MAALHCRRRWLLAATGSLLIACGATTIGSGALAAGSGSPAAAPVVDLELSTRLLEAIALENATAVETLLAAGADPNQLDPDGKTAVHRAAFADNLLLLELVLAGGGDPNARSLAGTTPLSDAILARSHPIEKLQLLLAAGADPNTTDPNGGTPLHDAARTNNGRAILLLLEAGADPLATTGRATFQDFYFSYNRAILNERALAERGAVADWLRQRGIPLHPRAEAD